MAEPVLLERDGAVAILTLNDPDRVNAFSLAMRDALIARMAELNEDPDCRAIVLTGTGPSFSAGGDLKDMREQTVFQGRARLRKGSATLMRSMIAGPKPIIAAVEGYAYGAGLALSAASDYVVAASNAKFSCAFIKVSLLPDLGLLWTLPRRIGLGRAKRYMVLGTPFDAVRAEAIGLVDDLTEPGGALSRAREVAEEMAQAPPLAVEAMKSALAEGLDDALRREVDLQPMMLVSEDFQEGKNAFFEKRKPRFVGR